MADYLQQRLWLNCYANFQDGQLVLTACLHRRDFKLVGGMPFAGEIEEAPCYIFVTVMAHKDDINEVKKDQEWSSLINNSPLLRAIRSNYPASVLREELRTSLEDYWQGGSGELEKHELYGQTTHYRDLELLEAV